LERAINPWLSLVFHVDLRMVDLAVVEVFDSKVGIVEKTA
jgi:hypothetical protein